MQILYLIEKYQDIDLKNISSFFVLYYLYLYFILCMYIIINSSLFRYLIKCRALSKNT